jgi:CcmD family protein
MQNFWYLFAAYMIIWTAIFAYIVHLSRKNRELRDELRDLQAHVKTLTARKETT